MCGRAGWLRENSPGQGPPAEVSDQVLSPVGNVEMGRPRYVVFSPSADADFRPRRARSRVYSDADRPASVSIEWPDQNVK